MKTITMTDKDIFGIYSKDSSNFKRREAARTVLIDETNKIALLYVSKEDVYKVPGGGVERDEEIIEALKREILEESGCNSEVLSELVTITETRNEIELFQTSFVFVSKVVGKKMSPQFTEKEKRKGFELIWVDLDEAIKLNNKCNPQSYSGKFIKNRVSKILELAKDYLK